ncbi:MAG: YlmC/YmxH family sporulation protein [Firmicutes bacterium]|nr:YlmC/YmxH family sporulation protein [Bacillota bacterium]
MRLSELAGKRIINLFDGEIIGTAGESDLLIDEAGGLITEIVLPPGRGRLAARRPLNIPWSAVRKIGPEVIVVDIEY